MNYLATQRRGLPRRERGVGLIRDGGRRRGGSKARVGAALRFVKFVNFSRRDRPRDRVQSQWI